MQKQQKFIVGYFHFYTGAAFICRPSRLFAKSPEDIYSIPGEARPKPII